MGTARTTGTPPSPVRYRRRRPGSCAAAADARPGRSTRAEERPRPRRTGRGRSQLFVPLLVLRHERLSVGLDLLQARVNGLLTCQDLLQDRIADLGTGRRREVEVGEEGVVV